MEKTSYIVKIGHITNSKQSMVWKEKWDRLIKIEMIFVILSTYFKKYVIFDIWKKKYKIYLWFEWKNENENLIRKDCIGDFLYLLG